MKIVHLLSQNHLTGAEVHAAQLSQAQIAAGHRVFQISNGFFYPTEATTHTLEVETKSKITFIKNIFWLRRFLTENKIQVIHTHSRASAKLAYWARIGLKVAMASTVHGRQHASISKKLFNQYGDFLIAICESVQTHLIKDFGYNPRRIKILRNPISEKFFSYLPRPEKKSYQKIAIIGRATGPKKERTEQVLKSLLKLKPDAEIFLVGGHLSQLAPEFKNKVTEVSHSHLTSADFTAFDLVIGSGRVCMEALITGVPTIAFGEATYVGLVQESTWTKALQTNFGDIDLQSETPNIDEELFKKDIQSFLSLDDLKRLSQKASEEFSLSSVSKKIMRLYQSAFFIRNHPSWIPVLMYHKIPSTEIQTKHRIFVVKKNFEKHLLFFKALGFQTLTFSDLQKYKNGEKDFSSFPAKPLVLTFDDGYRDNLENASPLLQKYQMRAQIFLLAQASIKNNQWDASSDEPAHEIISEDERQKWLTSAFEIGSHGFSHQKITEMTDSEAFNELQESKKSLEKEFCATISTYAYTYGLTSPKAAELAEKAGYDYAVNTDTGGLLLEESPYQIFRVNIFPEDSFLSLWKKTSTWYRQYYFNKRKK